MTNATRIARRLALALAVALPATTAHAELRLGIGVFTLSEGADLQLGYRFDSSHWLFGYRLLHYTEETELVSGTAISTSTTTKTGPFVAYLFRPEARGSWYAGTALMHWKQSLRSSRTGTRDEDSTVAPFFGGGYMGRWGGALYWNFGVYVSPVSLDTRTADVEEETTGADVQLQLGFAF